MFTQVPDTVTLTYDGPLTVNSPNPANLSTIAITIVRATGTPVVSGNTVSWTTTFGGVNPPDRFDYFDIGPPYILDDVGRQVAFVTNFPVTIP